VGVVSGLSVASDRSTAPAGVAPARHERVEDASTVAAGGHLVD